MSKIKHLLENYRNLTELNENTVSYLLKEVAKESILVQEDYVNATGLLKATQRKNIDELQRLEEIFDFMGVKPHYEKALNSLRGNKRGYRVKIHFQHKDKVFTDSREVYYTLGDKNVRMPYVIDAPNSIHPDHVVSTAAAKFRSKFGREPRILRIDVKEREEHPDGGVYASGQNYVYDYGKFVHPNELKIKRAIVKALRSKM